MPCESCRAQFTPSRSGQRFYSPLCSQRERTRRWRRTRQPVTHARACRWCRTDFETHDDRRSYCSDPCARIGALLAEVLAKYGITKDEYRDLWFAQEGKCAICRQPERTARNTLLAVDHDHATGAVRGLLCSHCNRAIGLLGDDPTNLVQALLYLGAA